LLQSKTIIRLEIATNRDFKTVVIGQGGCSMNAHRDYLFRSQHDRPKKSRKYHPNF